MNGPMPVFAYPHQSMRIQDESSPIEDIIDFISNRAIPKIKQLSWKVYRKLMNLCLKPSFVLLMLFLLLCVALSIGHVWMVRSIYESPLDVSNSLHRKLFYTSFQQYLLKNQVKSLLNVHCTLSCLLMQNEQLQGVKVTYIDHLSELEVNDEDGGIYSDWIAYYGAKFWEMDDSQVQAQAMKLREMAKTGVSIIWDHQRYNRLSIDEIGRVRRIFSSQSLTYNTIQSLKLRRLTGKVIQVYNRFYINSQSFEGSENEQNFVAIQTEIKLYRDIFFLREWIGYHTSIGVDKFFLYHTQQDEKECIELPFEEVQAEWLKIWKDYYTSIVYIPWKPKSASYPYPLSLLFPPPSSQHDYIFNYNKEMNFTVFLPPGQLIFSKIGMKLSKSMAEIQKYGYNSFELNNKYFLSRFCTGSKYLLENYFYYQVRHVMESFSYIFSTKDYRPNWGASGGYISGKQLYKYDEKEWRVNSYSLSNKELNAIKKTLKYPSPYFSYDYSSESRLTLSIRISDKKYFLSAQYSCPWHREDCPNRLASII